MCDQPLWLPSERTERKFLLKRSRAGNRAGGFLAPRLEELYICNFHWLIDSLPPSGRYFLWLSISQFGSLGLLFAILALLGTLVDWRGSRKWPWLWYLAQHTNYHSYSNALAERNLLNLSDRRESLCLSFALKCEKTLQKTPGIPANSSQSGLEQKDLRTRLYPTSHTYSISTIK